MKILCVVVSGMLLACAPEGRLPVEPAQKDLQDDPQQLADIPGPFPLSELPGIEMLVFSAKTTVVRTPPTPRRVARAWLEPDPSEHKFTHENPFWQTFTVKSSGGIDSLYVLTNPLLDGITRALETAGGNEAPFRNFCPAEWNDSPTRARRNGWNLHLSACEEGTTYLLMYGWREEKLDLYNIYSITVK